MQVLSVCLAVVFLLHLADKNEKKFAKVLGNEELLQKARSGTSSPSENSSLSEVLFMQSLFQNAKKTDLLQMSEKCSFNFVLCHFWFDIGKDVHPTLAVPLVTQDTFGAFTFICCDCRKKDQEYHLAYCSNSNAIM